MSEYQIVDRAFHRNGNAVPFVAALVDDAENDDVKLVIMFEDEDYTAVFSLDRLLDDEDISAKTNSWSGSRFEFLRDLLWNEEN
jgi:hypothetical protein